MNNNLSANLSIILCRPEGSANIGAVCRAMKTMGFHQLKMVAPSKIDLLEVEKWSVHAFNIFQEALFFDSLQDATAKSVLVAGTSRREGKKRKQYSLWPNQFANLAASYGDGTIDLVFGNERNGLNEQELNCCNHVVSIPVADDCGSLNLSHAVQVLCYELLQATTLPKNFETISSKRVKDLALHATQQLDAIGFFTIAGDYGYQESINFWYNVLGRAALNSSEEKFVSTLFTKMRYIKTNLLNQKEPNQVMAEPIVPAQDK